MYRKEKKKLLDREDCTIKIIREKKKREKNMPLEDTIVVHGRESAKRRCRKGAVGGEHKGGTA